MEYPDLNDLMCVAEEMLGVAPESIEAFKPPSGGLESWSFRVRSRRQIFYLKVNRTPNTLIGIQFNRRLAQAGLPVPEIIGWMSDDSPLGLPCALFEFADGEQANWLRDKKCPYDEAQCGDLLRQIHALESEGPFCFLGDEEPISQLGPIVESWADMFPCEQGARRCVELGWLSQQQAETLASLPEKLSGQLQQARKRLLHMDFMYNGNLIIEKGSTKIIAIVDGAEAMAGDPRLELAYFDYGFPGSRWPFNMEAFREGYGTDHDAQDDLNRFYMINILLFTRFMEGEINVGMALPNLLLLRTLIKTFE